MGCKVPSNPNQTGTPQPRDFRISPEQRAKDFTLQGKIHLDSRKTLGLNIICRAERRTKGWN